MEIDLNLAGSPAITTTSSPMLTIRSPTPPRHAPSTQRNIPRLDLSERKRRLDVVLGAQASVEYWSTVERYLAGQISRHELETVVLDKFSGSQISLHNDFFMAILYNAGSSEVPPPRPAPPRKVAKPPPQNSASQASPVPTSFNAKKVGSPLLELDSGSLIKREQTPTKPTKAKAAKTVGNASVSISSNPTILSTLTSAVTTSAAGPTVNGPAKKSSKKKKPDAVFGIFAPRLTVPPIQSAVAPCLLVAPPRPHQPMRHLGGPNSTVASLSDAMELDPATPESLGEYTEIRTNVLKRAKEAGLKSVSDDAVTALTSGLEAHLSAIIHGMIQHVGPDRRHRDKITVRLNSSPDDDRERRRNQLGVVDLLSTVINNPRLVGDELSLIRERIMLMLS